MRAWNRALFVCRLVLWTNLIGSRFPLIKKKLNNLKTICASCLLRLVQVKKRRKMRKEYFRPEVITVEFGTVNMLAASNQIPITPEVKPSATNTSRSDWGTFFFLYSKILRPLLTSC